MAQIEYARIHLLPAMKAPVVVVIRRKPSKVVHVMRWNTESDEIEHGSWFRGRIYELRSDLSPNGKWMVYLAMGSTGETWTGVCNPPWLKTAIDWPNCGTWNGGGVFRSDTRLDVNVGYGEDALKNALKEEPRLPLDLRPFKEWIYGEDEGVLYPRLARDGWRCAGKGADEERYPEWLLQPTKKHPVLHLHYRGYLEKRGRVFEFEMPELPGFLGPEVTWAAWDCLGQLVLARQGRLERYTLEALKRGEPTFSVDLEGLEPPERGEPAAAPATSPIVVRRGALSDQDVQVLLLPLRRSGSPCSPRLTELWDLAGPHLPAEYPDLGCNVDAGPVATPAYFLRQHTLVHVPEPLPDRSLEELTECCRLAFEEAFERGGTVASWCIGVEAGWPIEIAAQETVKAARAFVAEDSDDPRGVVLVADSDEEEAALRALVGE